MIPPRFHMRFPCSRKYAGRARRAFITFLAGNLIDPETRIELETAVGEAIANAIEHGYPHARWFQLRCQLRVREIVVEVEDDGFGFQADTARQAPPSGRGFGFGIMRSLVDELDILKNGRLVRFSKRLAVSRPECSDALRLASLAQDKLRIV